MQEIAIANNLSKVFSGRVVFRNVNLTIQPYRPIVVMGGNGCGKSTLLRIIAGELPATMGEVAYRPNIKTAFVPDRFPKLPFSVEGYLKHMGRIQGLDAGRIDDYISEYFELLKMPHDFRKTPISKCSKGTLQKVNIMQALITTPDLLVLDEPFAGLDEDSVENFVSLLHRLIADGVSILLACHERVLAQRVSDSIYVFADKGLVGFDANSRESDGTA